MTRKQLGLGVLIVGLFAGGGLIRAADQKNPNPAEPQTKAETVSQVYDIRDLTVPVQDFPLETSPHAGAFVSSARGGGQGGQSNPQGIGGGPVSNAFANQGNALRPGRRGRRRQTPSQSFSRTTSLPIRGRTTAGRSVQCANFTGCWSLRRCARISRRWRTCCDS